MKTIRLYFRQIFVQFSDMEALILVFIKYDPFFKCVFLKLIIAALLIDIIILVKIVIKAPFCNYINMACLAKLMNIIVFVKVEKVPFRKHILFPSLLCLNRSCL